ncbi:hypothetical protein B0H14DRAFT_3784319 [Mycena olivaceomarginata]|nr:hypothetical protein B0H14DRAFT_3784319 [Mycena olivaceomarginata]
MPLATVDLAHAIKIPGIRLSDLLDEHADELRELDEIDGSDSFRPSNDKRARLEQTEGGDSPAAAHKPPTLQREPSRGDAKIAGVRDAAYAAHGRQRTLNRTRLRTARPRNADDDGTGTPTPTHRGDAQTRSRPCATQHNTMRANGAAGTWSKEL